MVERSFVATSHQGKIIITRTNGDHNIEMSPSEASKATHILGLALSMVEMDPVPEYITETPFVVRFFPHRVYALERKDEKGSLPFRLPECDELITTINVGLGICLNEQTQGRVVPVGTAVTPGLVSDESF